MLLNKKGYEILGYKEGSLIGKNWIDLFIPKKELSKIEKLHKDSLCSGPGYESKFENSIITKAGKKIIVAWHNVVIRDDSGNVLETLSSGEDVTEKRKAEEALEESVEKYKALYESSSDSILTLSPPDWKFSSGNPATIKMFGTKNEKNLLDRTPWGFSPKFQPDGSLSSEKAQEMILKTMKYGSNLFKWTHKRLNGEEFPTTVLLTRTKIKGKFLIQATVRDISVEEKSKKLELQLQQSQKLEAIGRLAGGIAHDFNNLMTIVIGNASLLNLKAERDPESSESLKHIISAGEQAANLTNQLLMFNRKRPLEQKLVDLNAIILDMSKLLLRTLGENIKIETKLCQSSSKILAAPSQIEQILMNIILNALDAMSKGGEIIIKTNESNFTIAKNARRSKHKSEHFINLEIIDNGDGMDGEVLSQIFDPFFTTKKPGRGTGLGLSTVYAIIQQLGGHISATSTKGVGTHFICSLPISNRENTNNKDERKNVQIITNKKIKNVATILLVEDERMVAIFAQQVLEMMGYRIIIAHTAEEAISIVKKGNLSIDLLLTDVILPGMDGVELAKKVKAIREKGKFCSRGLKVLYVSGYDNEKLKKIKLDDANFLQKPYKPQILAQMVKQLLSNS